MKPYYGGIRHDYKNENNKTPTVSERHSLWFLCGLVIPIFAVTLFLITDSDEPQLLPEADSRALPAQEMAPSFPSINPLAETPSNLQQTNIDSDTMIIIVDRGETLEELFRDNSLSISDLSVMARLPQAEEHLRILLPGDQITVTHNDGQIISLAREIDEVNLLEITKGEKGFTAEILKRKVDTHLKGAHGIIQSSLFEAAQEAGVSDAVIMNMAEIFQWDIDFIQDVRIGDAFTIIFEELWRDGVKLGDGNISAAEFVNQGTSFRAARFIDNNGNANYFTPEGRNVRKAFTRAPVDFTRISSNFDPNRRHPVLNTIRAHRGVDYAAPTRTPIRAAGDGKVIFRGVRNGYGNTVILQHGDNITTLYAHMSRFASPKLGSRVVQGQTIGFVGMSGLATGPHLHYEYRINGVHRNPRTVPLPPADPIPSEYREDFQKRTAPLWQQLNAY
tara:strand:+ start:1761 stop:3101 length:1341 start_codon:yes stop_codon:yes gene_type:complete